MGVGVGSDAKRPSGEAGAWGALAPQLGQNRSWSPSLVPQDVQIIAASSFYYCGDGAWPSGVPLGKGRRQSAAWGRISGERAAGSATAQIFDLAAGAYAEQVAPGIGLHLKAAILPCPGRSRRGSEALRPFLYGGIRFSLRHTQKEYGFLGRRLPRNDKNEVKQRTTGWVKTGRFGKNPLLAAGRRFGGFPGPGNGIRPIFWPCEGISRAGPPPAGGGDRPRAP